MSIRDSIMSDEYVVRGEDIMDDEECNELELAPQEEASAVAPVDVNAALDLRILIRAWHKLECPAWGERRKEVHAALIAHARRQHRCQPHGVKVDNLIYTPDHDGVTVNLASFDDLD